VDAGYRDRQESVDAVDLQGQCSERGQPAHGRELGPIEMGTAAP
jgi:hypothetical protein